MFTNIDKEFQDWFKEPKQMADEVGTDIKVPRYSARQQHRPNAPAGTPLQLLQAQCWHPFLGSYGPRNEFKVL